MAIAQGIAKKLSFIKETTWGTIPANSSTWKYLRRVTSDLDVDKDTYQSNEIRTDYQIADFRHGGRRVTGSINGELSPGTYASFMAAAMRKDFATVTNITTGATTVTFGAPSNGVSTLTRSAGSWFTDGVRIGHVIKPTVGLSTNANKLLLVVGMTSATSITVMGINSASVPAAEGPTGTVTFAFNGKVTYTPQSAHTNDSFSVEHWFSDVSLSETFSGLRVNTMGINLPATGMATCNFAMLGKDVTTAGSQYSSSSSAATSTNLLTAVNGVLRIAGTTVGVVTGASLNYAGNASGVPVVGSNFSPDIFIGRVNVTGQMQALFENATLRDAFLNETDLSMILAMATDSTVTADFISFCIPRLKVGGARKNDGETGLSLTLPFQALYNSDGANTNGEENTTLQIHDSQAP